MMSLDVFCYSGLCGESYKYIGLHRLGPNLHVTPHQHEQMNIIVIFKGGTNQTKTKNMVHHRDDLAMTVSGYL